MKDLVVVTRSKQEFEQFIPSSWSLRLNKQQTNNKQNQHPKTPSRRKT